MATIEWEGTSATTTAYNNQVFNNTVYVDSNFTTISNCTFRTNTQSSATDAFVCDSNFIYSDNSIYDSSFGSNVISIYDTKYEKRQFCHPEYGMVSVWASKNATEEEVRELLEHEYSNIRNRREQNKLSEVAEIKAQDLLKDFIGEEELKVYNETGRLYVKGEKGEYIVRRGSTIQKIEGNKVIDFCVHLKNRGYFPPTDNVIALKFLLEEDENKVLKLANKRGSTSFDSIEELPLAACM